MLLTMWSLLGLSIVKRLLGFGNFQKSFMKGQVKSKTLDWLASLENMNCSNESNESICDMYTRFITYFSRLVSLCKKITNEEMVSKI